MDLLGLCRHAVDLAVQAGAEQVEVIAERGESVSARAEQNDLVGATSEQSLQVGIRVVAKGAFGFSTLNRADDASVSEAARNAVALARSSTSDGVQLPLPTPVPSLKGLTDPLVAQGTIEMTVERCHALLKAARAVDKRVSVDGCDVDLGSQERAIASSQGVAAFEEGTVAVASIYGMAIDGEDVSGFDHEVSATRRLADLEGPELGEKLGRKLLLLLNAQPYDGPSSPLVVLSPEAIEELLLEPLFASMDGDSVRRGRSQLAGKLGKAVGAPVLSVIDDPLVDGDIGAEAFDREGLGHKTLPLLQAGVLQTLLHNSGSARRMNTQSTGHASGGAGSVPGVDVTRVVVAAGAASIDELLMEAKDGLYLGRFAGSVDEVSGDFSGVVKNSFRIRGGKRVEALKETLVAGNVFEVMMQVRALSKERKALPGKLLPHALCNGVTVTAG